MNGQGDFFGTTSDRSVVSRIIGIAFLQTMVLLFAYYLLPARTDDPALAMRVVGSIVLVSLVILRQYRSVVHSEFRLYRSLVSISLAIPLVIVLYSGLYRAISLDDPMAFSEVLSKTDALYFTVTTLSTVGYGDISPASELARIVAMSQMVVNVLLIGFSLKIASGMVNNRFRELQIARQKAED